MRTLSGATKMVPALVSTVCEPARLSTYEWPDPRVASGLSRKWRLGVSEASSSSGKDAQRRRSRDCGEAEDAARGVEGRRDTVPISATDH